MLITLSKLCNNMLDNQYLLHNDQNENSNNDVYNKATCIKMR